MKSVASKMRFQVAREDREALKDHSNMEFLEYLHYQRDTSELNQQYQAAVAQLERD